MSEPFMSEIRMFGFNFAPRGWSFCDGQILPINQNQSLFSLLGTMYGGDGRTSFALPDLRGRTPLHIGDGYPQGQGHGLETVTLNASEIPGHTHVMNCDTTPTSVVTDFNPTGRLFAEMSIDEAYIAPTDPGTKVSMNPDALSEAGGGQSHNNMQPYTVVSFAIALQGIFPPRN